jgi:hypothetical protein
MTLDAIPKAIAFSNRVRRVRDSCHLEILTQPLMRLDVIEAIGSSETAQPVVLEVPWQFPRFAALPFMLLMNQLQIQRSRELIPGFEPQGAMTRHAE